jgi:multidrug efflux system outer membrane protein
LFKLFGIPQTFIDQFGLKQVIRVHEMLYRLPVNMSYELDLWGRLQGQYESALLNVQAQQDAYCTTLLALTSELASHYFNLRTLDAQAELLLKTIAVRQKNVDLTLSRFQKGITNYLDVAEANVDLSNAEAEYDDTIRQRQLMENAIAVLIGMPASEFCLEANPLAGLPPVIPPGIPSSVVSQRPDIAEAERTLASEHALIGVAYADFLPSFNLTGALGFSSPDFEHFMRWKSRYWNFTANIGQTLFDGWRKCSNLNLSWARYYEALGNYQQVVLVAFQEVEDALNNIEWQARQAKHLEKSVEAASRATHLSKQRYLQGVANYLEIVVNERSELEVRRSYINTMGQRFQSTIQLIKALGGGWEVETPLNFNTESKDNEVLPPAGQSVSRNESME